MTFSPRELQDLERMAKSIVEVCDLHAGRSPMTRTGDFSDVVVVTPDGEIPWREVSRISDEEMKALMIEVVDRVFTYMAYADVLATIQGETIWVRPKFDEPLMKTVGRRLAQRASGEKPPT